jgi:hypothetical protein
MWASDTHSLRIAWSIGQCGRKAVPECHVVTQRRPWIRFRLQSGHGGRPDQRESAGLVLPAERPTCCSRFVCSTLAVKFVVRLGYSAFRAQVRDAALQKAPNMVEAVFGKE